MLHITTLTTGGGVVNNQIKKGLLLSLSEKKNKIGEYLTKLQARRRLSRALCARLLTTLLKDEESARDNHVLVCYFAKHLVI